MAMVPDWSRIMAARSGRGMVSTFPRQPVKSSRRPARVWRALGLISSVSISREAAAVSEILSARPRR